MKVKVKVVISDRQNKSKVPSGIRMLLRRCCQAVLVNEKAVGNFEISLSFVDNDEIQSLNEIYRNISKDTDVLSFPMGSDGNFDINPATGYKMLGDIVISLEKAVVQADTFGHSLKREVGFLTTHSMLHLLGYDHEEGTLEASLMREKEEHVLSQLGLSRNESFVGENNEW